MRKKRQGFKKVTSEKDRQRRRVNQEQIHRQWIDDNKERIKSKWVYKSEVRDIHLDSTYNDFGDSTKQFVQENKRKPTAAENRFRYLFDKLKTPYAFQYPIKSPLSFYIVDFYIPKYGIVVEIDGNYHSLPGQIEKDRRRDIYLTNNKFTVIRITNNQMFEIKNHIELKRFLGLNK